MKVIKIVALSVISLGLVSLFGCKTKKSQKTMKTQENVLYTDWKCLGFGNKTGEIVEELAVQKCSDCFKMTLREDESFSIKSEINSLGGKLTVNGSEIAFENIRSTRAMESGLSLRFANSFSEIKSYFFTEEGKLILVDEAEKTLVFVREN